MDEIDWPDDELERWPHLVAAWREAQQVAEAHRIRVKAAVLHAIDAGMTTLEASRLSG